MSDRIRIAGLRVGTHIGVTDEERARPQAVLVDVEAEWDMSEAGRSDDIDDTIDYGLLTTQVADLVRTTRARTLERLAELIAASIAKIKGVGRVTVEVRKESPPVGEQVRGITVHIERTPPAQGRRKEKNA